MNRREFQKSICLTAAGAASAALCGNITGCVGTPGQSYKNARVWGRRGISDGRFQKPRAISVGPNDDLYIVDMTGRIQVFNKDFEFLRSWKTPETYTGRPVGLSHHPDGNLIVADTHYFRVLFYTPKGKLLKDRTIGGEFGKERGQFGLVTDVSLDSKGNYYIGEYLDNDRIQKFSPDGKFICQLGSQGHGDGEMLRPQSLKMIEGDRLVVVDSGNHRVLIYDVSSDDPKQIATFGKQGREAGEFRYPYGLDSDGEHLYICEFGNHRVQKLTLEGKPVDTWGVHGRREPGELQQPWALALNSKNILHVLDSYNHRVQTLKL